MRIAIILGPFLPVPAVRGGAVEKAHLTLAQAYRAAGHEVTILSRRYDGFPDEEVSDGVRHIRVPSSEGSSSRLRNLMNGFRYARRAAAALPAADVTITNEFSLPLVLSKRKAGKIYVQVGRYPKYQMWLYFRADRLQAVSRAVADAIARQTPWIADRVAVIGYAIGDAYFRPLPSPDRERTILFVGRIAREKGIELLIDAFVRLREYRADETAAWTLRIIGPHEAAEGGDGAEYLDFLQERARPLGRFCEFAGPVFDQDALIREYRRCPIYVYPSLAEFGEALPLAPLEAMASGCATIVSDLGCFNDYIEDGLTGLKFDHRAADAAQCLADALFRLITEPGLLQHIAAGGHKAAGRFRVEAIAARMIEDFRSLIGTEGPVAAV